MKIIQFIFALFLVFIALSFLVVGGGIALADYTAYHNPDSVLLKLVGIVLGVSVLILLISPVFIYKRIFRKRDDEDESQRRSTNLQKKLLGSSVIFFFVYCAVISLINVVCASREDPQYVAMEHAPLGYLIVGNGLSLIFAFIAARWNFLRGRGASLIQ